MSSSRFSLFIESFFLFRAGAKQDLSRVCLTSRLLRVSGFLCFASACFAQHEAPKVPFQTPSALDRMQAVGDLSRLSPAYQQLFQTNRLFVPKRLPQAADWLATQAEKGQSFGQFLALKPNPLTRHRRVLYIQPVGEFSEKGQRMFKLVADYAKLYFQMEVKVQKAKPFSPKITSRIHAVTGKKQVLSTDILRDLERSLPRDAYCRLAVTMEDLYPDPDWNYVFGQASIKNRVAVYSFARYGDDDPVQVLRRCLQVFVHETGHMFGIYHCLYYECIMNGSNHLAESDASPLHACPVCLRKFHHTIRFHPMQRYNKLHAFYQANGLKDEAQWMQRRIDALP